MSHEVETMMYVREKPWHGLGTMVEEAPTSADALKLAGLDWIVNQKPVYIENDALIPGYKANVRDKDNKVLGIVTDKYKVVQNAEAFAFTDALIGGDVKYECAGSLNGGKRVWLLARMPETQILGDDFLPYLCFTNTFDGSGAVKVLMSPIRIVCSNTLNLAISTCTRSWSMKHMKSLDGRVLEAQACLGLANKYMNELNTQAEKYANTSISDDEIQEFLNELFPTTNDMTDRQKATVKAAKDDWMVAYYMPDIKNFRNTLWAVANASSDFVGHARPQRMTKSFGENRWNKIMNGHPVMDKTVEIINRMMVKA